jgi:hypothetical protein
MGYTHYWSSNTVANARLADDVHKILAHTLISVRGPDGTGEPDVSADVIALNGDAALGEDFETFALMKEYGRWDFTFCKTGRRPYDEVVTAILVDCILHGDTSIGSDGCYEEWHDGIALYERTFGTLTPDEIRQLKSVIPPEDPKEREER